MAEARIDRQAWSKLVLDLIKTQAGGNKAAFARAVGVDPRTARRWQLGLADVSEANVRAVARAYNLNPLDMLVQVGYYSPEDVPTAGPPAEPVPEEDEEILLILRSDASDERKKELLERLHELRERDKQRRMDDIRWSLGQ